MPPLRAERASKACDTCRKQKTRCYASTSRRGTCLRCETLKQRCSLGLTPPDEGNHYTSPVEIPRMTRDVAVDQRLERLEGLMNTLIQRLDSRADEIVDSAAPTSSQPEESSLESQPAPVFLIRDVATEMGMQSPTDTFSRSEQHVDILSKGVVSASEAKMLLSIFQEHYGRWVNFDESLSTRQLFQRVTQSPLLLCSICLIAVRHTTDELAVALAPGLLKEAQSLISEALLSVADSVDFFQSCLILSLWSTTVGQVPLSIDGWLLTSYAIQQAQASPVFVRIFESTPARLTPADFNTWCIWNHLCLAHLQYCVGTRRPATLNEHHIDMCQAFADQLDSSRVSNFEMRMVAEVKLYWLIYKQCGTSQIDRTSMNTALHAWKQDWISLFDEPRSQFLQMGYHFAQLLTLSQSIKSTDSRMQESSLSDLIRLTTEVMTLAMTTTDTRTPHLTDHIYHIITFSAITLCRLLHTYAGKFSSTVDIDSLDSLVTKLVAWLRSIGLRCHVAHMLGDVVSAQQKRFRPETRTSPRESVGSSDPPPSDLDWYPEFISAEMFNIDTDDLWPPWDQMTWS